MQKHKWKWSFKRLVERRICVSAFEARSNIPKRFLPGYWFCSVCMHKEECVGPECSGDRSMYLRDSEESKWAAAAGRRALDAWYREEDKIADGAV